MKLYELEVLIYDGENEYTKKVQFYSTPSYLRGDALQQFLEMFCVDPKSEAATTVAEQWFHDNGQILIPNDLRLFVITCIGEVAPVIVAMSGSMICSVTQDGQEIPFTVEHIKEPAEDSHLEAAYEDRTYVEEP